jgi:GT2 family glycosyltransferase
MQRIRVEAEVLPADRPNRYRVNPAIRGSPLVSIIVQHGDRVARLKQCLASIEARTSYRNYEIIVVDNGSSSAQSQQHLPSLSCPVIHLEGAFNSSRMNNVAIHQCSGEYLLLMHDDTEIISSDWLNTMLGYAQFPEVGAVGAKLYYGDGTIQHAGIILGIHGVAGHWLRRFPGNSLGYFSSLSSTRNFSAVTAACMLLKREVFDSVGGFDEQLTLGLHDVDLCLKLRQAGYRIVCVPEAELYHYESRATQREPVAEEVEYFKKKWGAILLRDPYYNPNLSLESEALALRF